MDSHDLPAPVTVLGLSGLIPQLACLVVAVAAPDWHWVALAGGCFYAAIILSFLGGLWWMQALQANIRAWPIYIGAVAPSLVAWAALMPWCLGWTWPKPALLILAACVAASPFMDLALARHHAISPPWLRLRLKMAAGLSGLTLLLALT